MSSSESDEEEDQRPNFNILNDSLVDIYRNGREGSSGMDQQSCDGGGVEGGVSDEQSTAACDKSSDQQTSNSHETMSHDVVEPHPPSSMLAPVMSTSTNEGSSSPVECADAANSPLSEDGGSKQVTKKVSFSSPEVTDQHDYVVAEESRMRRVKKRKSKRHDDIDEGSKVKRKRSEDESSTSSHLRAGKSPEFAVQSSSVSFSDVGGSADCLHEINKLILHMRCSQLFEKLGVRPPQGFLLHGPPGCGKTLIAHAVAGELGLPFIKLAATEVVSGVSGESEGTLRDLFQLAKDHAPCVLFIDEVDAICRKRETAQREMERRIVTQLLTCLDDLNASTNGSRVLVIGATSRPDSLDPALRRAGRFDREICVGIPDLGSRVSILKVLCRNLRLKEGFNFSLVADLSPGFVGADLMALVTEAALVTINRVLSAHNQVEGGGQLLGGDGGSGPSTQGGVEGAIKTVVDDPRVLSQQELDSTFISTEDFIEAIKHVQPSAKREGFATVPNTTWADVGALQAVREELSMAILAPVRYPDQFDSLGLSSPPGVLLAGPPGCGKTLLAKAIANESGINFISVKGPELLNMYVGESERAVRQVFQRARNSSPCVIFFDELDALCPRRSDMAETSASARVVNQLLTEMDGLESRRQVFIMAATNRPDIIDPAVMRPGRLDKLLYVGLPSPSDRAAILNTITKGGQRPRLGPDVDLETVASDKYCKGFSGADLTAVVREASIDALKEHMTLNPLSMTTSIPPPPTLSSPQQVVQPAGECVVCMRHFVNAFQKTRASVSPKDQDFYQQMADRFHHQSSHNKN